MRISLPVAVTVLALAASAAAADIYVWRDTLGVSHYTTDLANVPPEFRAEAITVAKDWARAEPPPVAEEPVAAPASDARESTRALIEDAYASGYRAGEGTAAIAPMSSTGVAPLVQNFQNVQVQQSEGETRRDHLVPVIVEPHRRRPSRGNGDSDSDVRRRFPPAQHAPFLQGAAGPPPVSFE